MKSNLILILLIASISLYSQTYKQDSLKKAIKQYTKEIKRNSKDVDAYLNRGLAYSKLFDFDAAFADCNRAIQLDSSNYKAYYYMGLAKTTVPNDVWAKEAIIAFTKAIKLNPNYADAYYKRAQHNYNDPQQRLEDYNKTLELNPNQNSLFYYDRAGLREGLKDYKGSIEDNTKAIELSSKGDDYIGWFYQVRATCKRLLEDYAGALEDYKRAIELGIEKSDQVLKSEAYMGSAICHVALKDYEVAIEENTKGIEVEPKNTSHYIDRALAKYYLKDYEGAIVDYNTALINIPNYADAYLNRGYCRFNLGYKNSACMDWMKAYELNSTEAKEAVDRYCLNMEKLVSDDNKMKILSAILITDASINGNDLTTYYREQELITGFYTTEDSLLYVTNVTNSGSQSFGALYSKKPVSIIETNKSEVYNFKWSFENTYDSIKGEADLQIIMPNNPANEKVTIKIIPPNKDIIVYKGYITGYIDFNKYIKVPK